MEPATAEALNAAYDVLRAVEHRVQMIADEQTHRLPEADGERARVAALFGHDKVKAFDAAITEVLKTVNRRYGELFPDEEPLSSTFGSLIFTGVDDDPATLKTLARMGFDNPLQVSQTIRAWHHGRIPATRTERGRELFTRLAPRLLEAAHATGAPNAAFNRFSDFFASLSSGVQIQSLFLANPKLFELLVQVLAFAPKLAATLARRPAAIDALIDGDFFAEIDPAEDETVMAMALARAEGFEEVMDAVRRVHREQAFRLGVQVMSGVASAEQVGAGEDVGGENFGGRVMRGWGMDYEGIRRVKPDLVMLSRSGFGRTGPWKDRVSYGQTLQAWSGFTELTGFPNTDPCGPASAYSDAVGGMAGAQAVLLALIHRARTGQGQWIDLSQFEVLSSLLGTLVLDLSANGADSHNQRTGNRPPHASVAPHGAYRCQGDDRWVAISVLTENEWESLTGAMGHPPWAQDERFATASGRSHHSEELDALLETWTMEHSAEGEIGRASCREGV